MVTRARTFRDSAAQLAKSIYHATKQVCRFTPGAPGPSICPLVPPPPPSTASGLVLISVLSLGRTFAVHYVLPRIDSGRAFTEIALGVKGRATGAEVIQCSQLELKRHSPFIPLPHVSVQWGGGVGPLPVWQK